MPHQTVPPSNTTPFGGPKSTRRKLLPQISPPKYGYRLIPGAIWWRKVFWLWRKYLSMRSINQPFKAPALSPRQSTGVYFTDEESLEGISTPESFAKRLGLSQQTQIECLNFGCAIIKFQINMDTITPPPLIAQQGLTVGGAREWITKDRNVLLNDTMKVVFIDETTFGPRWFEIPL